MKSSSPLQAVAVSSGPSIAGAAEELAANSSTARIAMIKVNVFFIFLPPGCCALMAQRTHTNQQQPIVCLYEMNQTIFDPAIDRAHGQPGKHRRLLWAHHGPLSATGRAPRGQ